MKTILRLKPANSWNGETMYLCAGEDFETPVLHVRISALGYKTLTNDEQSKIVRSILHQLDEVRIEIPGEVPDYVGAPKPSWLSAGASRVRIEGGRGSAPGEIRIPEGAKFLANGEIDVPARSLDSSSPTAKSFRRACRKARNAVRELAEKSGRTVEQIMLEIMEKAK